VIQSLERMRGFLVSLKKEIDERSKEQGS